MHGLPHFILSYTACLHIMITHACMVSLFLSYKSPFLLHVLLFHVTVFMLYDCFMFLLWIFPLLDMRAVDKRYVGIPHLLFPFLVILFPLYCSCFPLYCSMLSTELWSRNHVTRIMHYTCSCYLVYLTHKDHLGMGET